MEDETRVVGARRTLAEARGVVRSIIREYHTYCAYVVDLDQKGLPTVWGAESNWDDGKYRKFTPIMKKADLPDFAAILESDYE